MTVTEANSPGPISKVRLRFAKTDDLRFLSHHDLMRLMERLLRRTGLPFRSSAGFHPKPKMVFANALSLGIVGRREVVEIEFDGLVEPQTIFQALVSLAPEGLTFLSAAALNPRHNAQPLGAVYFFPLPSDGFPELAARLIELLQRQQLIIERVRHVPQRPAQEEPLGEERLDALTRAEPVKINTEQKKIDLRPFLKRLWRDEQGLWMDLGITNQGAARPEEVLRLLGLETLMQDGEAILERVELTLADEAGLAATTSSQESGCEQPSHLATAAEQGCTALESAILITMPV